MDYTAGRPAVANGVRCCCTVQYSTACKTERLSAWTSCAATSVGRGSSARSLIASTCPSHNPDWPHRRKLGTAQSGPAATAANVRPIKSAAVAPCAIVSSALKWARPGRNRRRTVCEVEWRIAQPALCLPLHAGHLPSFRKPQTAQRPPLSGRESPQGTHSTLLLGPWRAKGWAVPARSPPAPTSRASSRQAPGPTQDLACPTHSRTLACRTALRSAAAKPALRPGVSGQGCAPMHAQHVQPTGQRTFGSVKRVQPLRP